MTAALDIAVVIPAYNAEAFLREALDSVMAQDLQPVEVVVIDDGSTDRTGEIARSFGPAIRLISQPNGGVASARNAGIAATAAPWVALLDADDRWPASSLALRAEAALDGVDAVIGDIATFSAARPEPVHIDAPGYLPSATLIRRSAFERCGLFATTLRVGDYIDWCDRARAAGLTFRRVQYVCVERRLRSDSLSGVAEGAREGYLDVVRRSLARRRAGGSTP